MAATPEIAANLGHDSFKGLNRSRLVFCNRLVSDLPRSQRYFAQEWLGRRVDSVSCRRPRQLLRWWSFRLLDPPGMAARRSAQGNCHFWWCRCDASDPDNLYRESILDYAPFWACHVLSRVFFNDC